MSSSLLSSVQDSSCTVVNDSVWYDPFYHFLLQSFDGCVAEQMVHNANALTTIHNCFYHLSPSNQLWSLDKLLDIVKKYIHNQQKCCQGGLIGHLLSLLAQHHRAERQLSEDAIGNCSLL